MNTSSQSQPDRPLASTAFDDPVAFAHELYSRLAALDDPRVNDPNRSLSDALDAAVDTLRAALAPEPHDIRTAINRVHDLAVSLACLQHSSGIEFGVAAEQLRQTLLASADGPRLPGIGPNGR